MIRKQVLSLFLICSLAVSSASTVYAAPVKKRLYAVPVNSMQTDSKELPQSVDLRKRGLVTSIKDQSVDGTCWAHATLGSIETANIKENPHIDLSERYLAYYMETDEFGAGLEADSINNGSNAANAAALLSNWIGPVSESKAPYNEEYGDNRSRKEVQAEAELHVTGINSVSFIQDGSDLEEKYRYVKQLLNENNALYISMNFDVQNSLNTYTSAYYYDPEYTDEQNDCSHAMLLVGYDDNYPVENFLSPPKENGAWLVKNSWGLSEGDYGYYWVSYEDPTIDGLYYFNTESPQLHDNIYAYDDFGGSGAISTTPNGDKSIYLSNVYIAEETGYITDVMLDCIIPEDSYEIKVYTDLNKISNPISGTVHNATVGVMEHTGYQMITLSEPVHISCGEIFSVTAKISGEQGYHAACELASNYSTQPSASTAYSSKNYAIQSSPFLNTKDNILMSFNQNQSFFSEDGKSWTDIYSLYSEKDSNIIGNLCLKALTVNEGTVHFSSYSDSLPAGSQIELSCADGKEIYYSVNGGDYSVYTKPIPFKGEMTVSAYPAGDEDKVYTQHYSERTAEISSLLYCSGIKQSYADVTKSEVDITVPMYDSDTVMLRPITTGTIKLGNEIINSYDTFYLDSEIKPQVYTITAQEDGLLSKDYNITVRKEYSPYFREGKWNSLEDKRWYYFSGDKKTGYYLERSDGSKNDFTYKIKDSRISLKTKDSVYEGYITDDASNAIIMWDDGHQSYWNYDEIDNGSTKNYTNPELCEMTEKYCEAIGVKPDSVTAEFDSGTNVIITASIINGEDLIFVINACTGIGMLQDEMVVNLNILPERTDTKAFKSGIWKSCDEDGRLNQIYCFDANGKDGYLIDLNYGEATEFTYNYENGQGIFNVSFEDYSYSERKAIVLHEDTAILTSEFDTVEYLSYHSSDTIDTFGFYSFRELEEIVSQYYEAEKCLIKPFNYFERNTDGTVTIYESIPEDDLPPDNLACYYVDIFTAECFDSDGNEVDLFAPEYVSENIFEDGIWAFASHEFEDNDRINIDYLDIDYIESLDYYFDTYYWIKNDLYTKMCKANLYKIDDDEKGIEYICRMTEGNGITEQNEEKVQFYYFVTDDAVYLYWDKTEDYPARIEKLVYLNNKTLDTYKFYGVFDLVTLTTEDCMNKTGIEVELDSIIVDKNRNAEIVFTDIETGNNKYYYTVNQYTGEGTDLNGDVIRLGENSSIDTPDNPVSQKILGDVDGDGKITSSDSLIILRASVKLESLSAEQFKCADVDGDKVISSGDALSVLRCSVHLLDNENIGKPIEKSVL